MSTRPGISQSASQSSAPAEAEPLASTARTRPSRRIASPATKPSGVTMFLEKMRCSMTLRRRLELSDLKEAGGHRVADVVVVEDADHGRPTVQRLLDQGHDDGAV